MEIISLIMTVTLLPQSHGISADCTSMNPESSLHRLFAVFRLTTDAIKDDKTRVGFGRYRLRLDTRLYCCQSRRAACTLRYIFEARKLNGFAEQLGIGLQKCVFQMSFWSRKEKPLFEVLLMKIVLMYASCQGMIEGLCA